MVGVQYSANPHSQINMQVQARQAQTTETVISRYIFSLRSEIRDEIEYALPNLARHSYERREWELRRFAHLAVVEALLAWPLAWLEDLKARRHRAPAWQVDEAKQTRENRASTSLLILRNAAAADHNAVYLARPLNKLSKTLAFIVEVWSLPLSELLAVSLEQPEPLLHTLGILHSLILNLPNTNLNAALEVDPSVERFQSSPEFIAVLQTTLPRFVQASTDQAFHLAILPILAQTPTLSYLPPPIPASTHALISHLFVTLALPASSHTLPVLDTLFTHTLAPKTAIAHINAANLHSLARFLDYNAQPSPVTWPAPVSARSVRNPASEDVMSERAEAQRAQMRRMAGGYEQVGDKQITLPERIRSRLVTLPEPDRCIAWMHKTFAANPEAELTQITFWTAYKDFFAAHSSLLSASEVIKNVTTAFPGALAKVSVMPDGTNRFVIAGLGFRKSTDAIDRFVCRWAGCAQPIGPTSATTLEEHLQTQHLVSEPQQCRWASCTAHPFSLSHLLTHFPPLPTAIRPSDYLSVSDQPVDVRSPTSRPPPLLPEQFRLGFTAQNTPLAGQPARPAGEAALAALTLRNLARALRAELAAELETETDHAERVFRAGQRMNGLPDKHGLPIPESVLKEEADEGEGETGADVERLGPEQREKAKEAFKALEPVVEHIMVENRVGLGEYLAECWGW